MAFSGSLVCPECGGITVPGDASKGKKVGAVLCTSCADLKLNAAKSVAQDDPEEQIEIGTRREGTLPGVMEDTTDGFFRISFVDGDDKTVRLEIVPLGSPAVRIAVWRKALVKAMQELGITS